MNLEMIWFHLFDVFHLFYRSNKCAKRIILFTTFTTEVNDENVDRIIEGLNALEIELIVM